MENNNINTLDAKPFIKFGKILLTILFFIFFVWGAFAPLKSVVIAPGKLIVSGQNKEVQHLYGGIVSKILVKDGDIVKTGQSLLVLDSTQAKAQYNVLNKQKYELLSQMSRFNSIITGRKTIAFDKELSNIKDKVYLNRLISSQTAIFNSEKLLLLTQDEIIGKKIQSIKGEIKGAKESLLSKKEYMNSIDEEIGEWRELFKQKLVGKVNLRDLKRKKITLKADITQYYTSISKLQIQILELQEQSQLQKSQFLNGIISESSTIEAKLGEIEQNIISSKDILYRSVLRSSIDGTVQNMTAFTKDGVIQAGTPIMSIVPSLQELVIEAKMAITDIDQVHKGMSSNVMFSAFDTQSTFLVEGVIEYVSADSSFDQKNNSDYYLIKISFTDNGKRQIEENNFTLQSGMPAEAMIQTSSRTMLSYLIQPFKDMTRRAFNED